MDMYSPSKASLMAEYKVAREVVELNSESNVPSVYESIEGDGEEGYNTFLTAPTSCASSPARVSPARDHYSPSKSSAMAEYKVAREVVEGNSSAGNDHGQQPGDGMDVSESDIEALKKEMIDLRSQLGGVTEAVVEVAKELTGVRNVTQSLPSPKFKLDYEYDDEEEDVVVVKGEEEGRENGFAIQEALEREVEEGIVRSSRNGRASIGSSLGSLRSTLRASGGSMRSKISGMDENEEDEEEVIPPPPPTPPTDDFDRFDYRSGVNPRSSLDMAAATRDLEEWGGDHKDGFSVKVTGLDLTIKNVRFPESVKETVGEAVGEVLNLPSPPRRKVVGGQQPVVETKVRTIEEKVRAVMTQAKRGGAGGGVGKALGLSVDERGWKDGIVKGRVEGGATMGGTTKIQKQRVGGESVGIWDKSAPAVNESMDDTMFSPEAKTRQEKEAKMLRRGMRKEERETREERERRAMEERRVAFNAVFGKGGGGDMPPTSSVPPLPPSPPPALVASKMEVRERRATAGAKRQQKLFAA